MDSIYCVDCGASFVVTTSPRLLCSRCDAVKTIKEWFMESQRDGFIEIDSFYPIYENYFTSITHKINYNVYKYENHIYAIIHKSCRDRIILIYLGIYS